MNVFWRIPPELNLTSNVFAILHRITGTFSTILEAACHFQTLKYRLLNVERSNTKQLI